MYVNLKRKYERQYERRKSLNILVNLLKNYNCLHLGFLLAEFTIAFQIEYLQMHTVMK